MSYFMNSIVRRFWGIHVSRPVRTTSDNSRKTGDDSTTAIGQACKTANTVQNQMFAQTFTRGFFAPRERPDTKRADAKRPIHSAKSRIRCLHRLGCFASCFCRCPESDVCTDLRPRLFRAPRADRGPSADIVYSTILYTIF